MSTTPFRWGILGCGNIAHKFCQSMQAVVDGEVMACASQTPGKAAAFAEKNGIAYAHTDYPSLLARDDLDAIYVATTHNFHRENINTCLEAGLPVLCEKPLTVNATETAEVIALARTKGLFLMEGMWTRFLPAIQQMKRWLDTGEIGAVNMLRADFCFQMPSPVDLQSRLFNPALAGGATLDVGIYPLSIASYVLGGPPTKIQALAHLAPTGVDERTAIVAEYPSGALALLSCAITSKADNGLEIAGEQGRIVIPQSFFDAGEVELHPNSGEVVKKTFPYDLAQGFAPEIRAVQADIRAGRIENATMPLDETFSLAETMDRVLATVKR